MINYNWLTVWDWNYKQITDTNKKEEWYMLFECQANKVNYLSTNRAIIQVWIIWKPMDKNLIDY